LAQFSVTVVFYGDHFHFVYSNVTNFVKIGKTVAEISTFFVIFKMAAAAIMDFQKVEIEGQCASTCQISSKLVKRLERYGDLTVFKTAAV